MVSSCPFCNRTIEGSLLDKRETSLLRSTFKFCSSLLISVPFVGSYISGQLYDWCTSLDKWYYRFVCPHCFCSWIATNYDKEMKVGGNKNLVTFFYKGSFVIGAIEDDFYLICTKELGIERYTVVHNDGNSSIINEYVNGTSAYSSKMCGIIELREGLFVGEFIDNKPHGSGMLFQKNGIMWYGAWQNGKKHGIGYECGFDGNNYRAGFWQNNNFII